MITTLALLIAGTVTGNSGPGGSLGLGPTSPLPVPLATSHLRPPSLAPATIPPVPYCFGGTITADNSYIIGLGTNTLATVMASECNTTAEEIFGCGTGMEGFGLCFTSSPLPKYVYIVAWSDDLVTSGVLADLTLDFPIYSGNFSTKMRSGHPAWRVYATGIDIDDCTAPSLATINAQIAIANAGSGTPGTTSVGWVSKYGTVNGRLQVGERNNDLVKTGTCGNAFDKVCGMTEAARWMWYQSPGSPCAFTDGNQREMLIFRAPLSKFVGANLIIH